MTENISKKLWAMDHPDAPELPEHNYAAVVQTRRDAWNKYEKQILTGLVQLTGLHFYLPVIDVTNAPYLRAFSTPLTIGFKSSPDEFIDILTHELIHIILSDNRENIHFNEYLDRRFKDEPQLVKNHVLVHAIHEKIYLDILNAPERMERDKEGASMNPPYARAWEIVTHETSSKLLHELQKEVHNA